MNPPSYEQQLGRYIYGGQQEKTFIDKTLARNDVEEMKEIMEKDDLTRGELLKLLFLISGNEMKLLNFGDFERYLGGKFYAWIRDFVSCAELLYDYKAAIEKKKFKVNENTRLMLENIRRQLLHNIKFLVDVFFYLSRSTLSLEATGFDTITKNRYEYFYPEGMRGFSPQDQQKKGFFNINLGKK